MDHPQKLAPTNAPVINRLLSLDFIRGIAVMGILWANIVGFGQPMTAYFFPGAFAVPHGEISNWLWVVQFILIDGKMRGLFTLLFGAGLMLFMEKAEFKKGESTGGAVRWLQARRLFWLLTFGLIHFYFLWRGDILVLYSIAGFAAMAFLRWSATNQLVIGMLGYGIGAVISLKSALPPYLIAQTDLGKRALYAASRGEMVSYKVGEIADGVTETAIIRSGSYSDFVAHNFFAHGAEPLLAIPTLILETLSLMLIGMALYQMGLFNDRIDKRTRRIWGWAAVIAGSLLTLGIALWSMAGGLTYWVTMAAFIGLAPLPRLATAVGLLALLTIWGPHMRGSLGSRVIAAGRMAFSNYLGTSILMMLVFHGWAGGLFGYLNRPQLYLVAAAASVLMLLWSKPWLEQFRYGPLEWLWRCLTYWKIFRLKK